MKTRCVRQWAFMQKLNYLMAVHEVSKDGGEEMLRHYKETYENFVNLWCPTLKDEYLPEDEYV